MDLEHIQQALRDEKIDGWLFYDFRKSNPIAYRVLSLPLNAFYSRRWFYFVPAQGTPTAIVSAVEPHVLNDLPGEHRVFRTWQDLHALLKDTLQSSKKVAMEYSPMNAIPYIARVDAGTVELVRSADVEVVSSADLSQYFVACLNPWQIETHRMAGKTLIAIKDKLFAELGEDLRRGRELDEYTVVQRFGAMLEAAGLNLSQGLPHVAVNANASNPHYEPTATTSSPIKRGDLILFDFWATTRDEGAIVADYTWMAFAGTRDEIPRKQREVFEVVKQARDTAVAFIRERIAAGKRVQGCEVDDVCRAVIVKAGYGDYFVHRTGHSLTTATHGEGANNDNYETHDSRSLLPDTCCTIEPGIYLPEFGVRSEIDLIIGKNDVEVTGVPVQEEIVPLLS